MKWADILQAINKSTTSRNEADVDLLQLLTDSRLLKSPGETVFFALQGKQDSHDYIPALYKKGVRHFITEKELSLTEYPEAQYIKVDSTLAALHQVARHKRELANLIVVGITGSNGKTTVKEWLSAMLVTEKNIVKTPKSYNSQIGVPLSVWNITSAHEIGVFEAGISLPNEMSKLESIIQPDIGIFTSIGPAHADGFSNEQHKIDEKAKLFKNSSQIICCKDHTAVYQTLDQLYGPKVISWSTKTTGASIFVTHKGQNISFIYQHKTFDFTIPFDFSIWSENCIHAVIAAVLIGVSPVSIQSALNHLQPVKMRLSIKKGIQGCYVIDDTYNNDLQGLEVALDYLKRQKQKKNKTLILSEMIGTGLTPEQLAKRLTDLIKSSELTRLLLIGDWTEKFLQDFSMPIQHYESKKEFLSNLPSFRDEMILVKGARPFQFEDIVRRLEEKSHQTRLEVNFEAIIQNLNEYRKHLHSGVKLLSMVKAFGYGGGSAEIANLLQFHNIDYLGVAYTDEAFQLRQNGINCPIMVMNPDFDQISRMHELAIEPEIYSLTSLKRLAFEESTPPIHIKVETGMNRLGFLSSEWEELANYLMDHPQLTVAGIFTHLSSSDDPSASDFTHSQINLFNRSYDLLTEALGYKPIKHALNSAGIIRYPEYQFDMVRLGIGLYGYDPVRQLALRQASRLVTHVSQVKQVKMGDTVGYSRVGQVTQDGQIAILPIGYADGFDRRFGNGVGTVIWNGQTLPTIGNICMDMTMIDIKNLPVREGDEIEIFGEHQTVEVLANQIGTIPYEILTSISQRVVRVYQSE